MKIKIRKGMFETNSSSVHSINIIREPNNKVCIPKEITLNRQEFGWEECRYHDSKDKLNYFFEMCLSGDYEDNMLIFSNEKERYEVIENYSTGSLTDRFVTFLKEDCGVEKVECNFGSDCTEGYIDHGDEWANLPKQLLDSPEILKKFLFSFDSCVLTSNDNTDYPEINIYSYRTNKNYDVYIK